MTPVVSSREMIRWTASAVVVVLTHVGTAAALMHFSATSEPAEPAAAMVIELAPMPVSAPAPPTEAPPGPEQVQNDVPPDPVTEQAETPPDPQPEPEAVQEPEKVEPPPPPPPMQQAAVELPPPPKPKPTPPKKKPKPRVETTSAPKPIESRVERASAAPAEGAPSVSRQSIADWRGQAFAHIQRYKRYPGGNAEGTSVVSFAIDRSGNVSGVHIVRSSGSSELDQESLAVIRRASPLPAPPPGIPGIVSVPLRYSLR